MNDEKLLAPIIVLACISLLGITSAFIRKFFQKTQIDPQDELESLHDEPCAYCYPECTCNAETAPELRPCGGLDFHYEDLMENLNESLTVGQIYETIASCENVRCHKDGGAFWLAWIRSYTHAKCCGINELVAFHNKPPKYFVFSLNGKVIEVCGDGLHDFGRYD